METAVRVLAQEDFVLLVVVVHLFDERGQLRELGCDLGQGYLFSGPLRRAKLDDWVRRSPWGMKTPELLRASGTA